MKKLAIAALVCFTSLLVPAYSRGADAKEGKVKIGVALDNLNDPFWLGIKKGIDDAGRDLKVELVVRTAEGDAVKQNNQIDDLIAQGVSGIVCVYVDFKSILQAVTAANKARYPLRVHRPDPGQHRGREGVVGHRHRQLRPDGERLEVDGGLRAQEQDEAEGPGARRQPHRRKRAEALGGLQGSDEGQPRLIQLVQQVPTEWNLEKALAGTTNALQAHPEINVVFMHSDYLLGATISALRQAGRYKKIGEAGARRRDAVLRQQVLASRP